MVKLWAEEYVFIIAMREMLFGNALTQNVSFSSIEPEVLDTHQIEHISFTILKYHLHQRRTTSQIGFYLNSFKHAKME